MIYAIMYTGLASTPDSIRLTNLTTGEIIHNINTSRKTGKQTRKAFNKYRKILEEKYVSILKNKK